MTWSSFHCFHPLPPPPSRPNSRPLCCTNDGTPLASAQMLWIFCHSSYSIILQTQTILIHGDFFVFQWTWSIWVAKDINSLEISSWLYWVFTDDNLVNWVCANWLFKFSGLSPSHIVVFLKQFNLIILFFGVHLPWIAEAELENVTDMTDISV